MEADHTGGRELAVRGPPFLRIASGLLLAAVLLVLVTSASLRAPNLTPAPAGSVHAAADGHPVIDSGGCTYVPDSADPRSFACSDYNQDIQYAYVGAPIFLDLNVSSPDASAINVTVWWDTQLNFSVYPFVPEPVNASAVQYFDVTPTGANQPVHIATGWTYTNLSKNDIVTGTSSYYNVFVNVTGAAGYDPFDLNGCTSLPWGNCFFKLAVAINSAPILNGLQAGYSYHISFPQPVIPAFAVQVSVQDTDNDPVTVTWDWDDGNVTVNATGPAAARTFLNVTHAYDFSLADTPREVYYHLNVSWDDGVPTHNTTTEVLLDYYVGYDGMPTLRFLSPAVGSPWEIAAEVPIEASLSDLEGDLMTYRWEYGDGGGTSEATTQNGTVSTSHAYSAAGAYNITLWATDGADKGLCLDLNCTSTRSHWVNLSLPIQVHPNRAPIISLTISSDPGTYGKDAGFAVAVLDPDWDNLTVTWSFGDDTWAVNLTAGSATAVQVTQAHNYTTWGAPPDYLYAVTVWVDDGHGHNVTSATEIFIGSQNLPPVVAVELLLANNTVRAYDTFTVNVTVSDYEGDPVWIDVDFGDGEHWNGTNGTMHPRTNYTFQLEHAYVIIGNYTINVTVTDHMLWVRLNRTSGELISLPHNTSVAAVIEVQAGRPPPLSGDWTWVDYATLAAVLALPVAASARAGYRRYLERKED